MKRVTVLAAIVFLMAWIQPVCAAIIWQVEDFEQFRFAIENNGGSFYYSGGYFAPGSEDKETFAYNPSQSQTDPYTSVATGNLTEFGPVPGEIQLDAMAAGPDGGINPDNGLAVQGYLEVSSTDLTAEHGIDVQQRVITFVSRQFRVDADGDYPLEALLTGTADFNSFFQNDNYRSAFDVEGTVTLELLVPDENRIEMMAGFPLVLSLDTPSQTVDVPLIQQTGNLNDVYYQLKVRLVLETELDNFWLFNFSIQGPLDTNYSLGSAAAPFRLQAVIDGEPDSDGDGVPNASDNCPDQANADQLDGDGDGVGDVCDECPADPDKTSPGACGCGTPDTDTDLDGTPDCNDGCPDDPDKTDPGSCGCGAPDTDTDGDGAPDCIDECDEDPLKTDPGSCGCGVVDSDSDTDGDGFIDCVDAFPDDPNEWEDTDGDGSGNNGDPDDENDGMPDDWENLYGLDPLEDDASEDFDGDGAVNIDEYRRGTDPTDPQDFPPPVNMTPTYSLLLQEGDDGGDPDPDPEPDSDADQDGVPDALDNCPAEPNPNQFDSDGDGHGDACDACPQDADKTSEGICGCGIPDTDADGDGTPDCVDECPDDPDKTAPEVCGCGIPDTDANGNDILDCLELNCEELINDDCNLPAPENLTQAIETDGIRTYVRFSWTGVTCAPLYVIRVGTVENLQDLPLGDPNYAEIVVNTTTWRANFSDADSGTYYWTVAPACSEIPPQSGAWSQEIAFEF